MTLPKLLQMLETETDPYDFKEWLLEATQLYFDGLVENKPENAEVWPAQEIALNALLQGLRTTTFSYYQQEKDIPFATIREIILPQAAEIIKYGSTSTAKPRHLAYDGIYVKRCVDGLVNRLPTENLTIIPIASGGFEPAALLAERVNPEKLFPMRYSKCYHNDAAVLVPPAAPSEYAAQQIEGKNVLIIDDVVCTGMTAEKVIDKVKKHDPATVYFATVIGKFPFHTFSTFSTITAASAT